MDTQSILVFALFAAAAVYLGRMLYANVKPKKGNACGSNCKCGMDFSQVSEKK
ncbi:FeoB-associated Cys-rich membrane protein [Olivibacter sp. SDN3]|uniref:FeoB-associated Cys-rich membrane protein n=1 Tax=Olivibacter sp. SDN3 TaxID=2764720 RepID=UPI00165112AD|nr:FeoB-associated Cys-rich membrane protein [Olivibacter sp. SDN3]QNL51422.1 FeoB-associated Cys-rich membrane protein [Olivibacter sp. SDN3]